MKVDYISDLHIDFWVKEKNPGQKMDAQLLKYIDMIKLNPGNDVLIIAGDLGHYFAQDSSFLLMCKLLYKYVLLVPGNHDRYLVSNAQQKKYMYSSKNRILEMKRFCAENNIIYLDGQVVVLDGYRFAGTGMSWDKSFYESKKGQSSDTVVGEHFKNTMNDAKLIFEGSDNYYVHTAYGGKFLQSSFNPSELFQKEKEKLEQIRDYDNVDVMVTHYTPTNPYVYSPSEYSEDLSSTFYMFNGEKDIERISPKYWVFGHMHNHYDFNHKGTNFLCNPLGYPGENTYTVVKTIEL